MQTLGVEGSGVRILPLFARQVAQRAQGMDHPEARPEGTPDRQALLPAPPRLRVITLPPGDVRELAERVRHPGPIAQLPADRQGFLVIARPGRRVRSLLGQRIRQPDQALRDAMPIAQLPPDRPALLEPGAGLGELILAI